MRFLNTSTHKLTRDDDREYQDSDGRYVILSHRWLQWEIKYETLKPADLINHSRQGPQLTQEDNYSDSASKIIKACAKAKEQGLKWLWIDTCCINKTNAVEESASINSMFEWYSKAVVCYAYLADVVGPAVGSPVGPEVFKSQSSDQWSIWFKRGWTLQELLAPKNMEFYDQKWKFLGTKENLASFLKHVTKIEEKYLVSNNPLNEIEKASVATRMSWMAGRSTTRVEDIAYSMLGIFNMTLTPQYGEGEKAFMRLQKMLMEASSDESIFAWTAPEKKVLACFGKPNHNPPKFAPWTWGILAPSPDCFEKSGDVVVIHDKIVARLNGGYGWTQQGIQFQMPMKAGTETTNMFGVPRKEIELPLNCWRCDSSGTPSTVVIRLIRTDDGYQREQCNVLRLKKRREA